MFRGRTEQILFHKPFAPFIIYIFTLSRLSLVFRTSNEVFSCSMIKIYASIFVVLLNICFVLSHVITIEVKGRLLCNGKEHGKVGLDGWPKKVYLWDMTDDGEFEIPLFLIYNICRYFKFVICIIPRIEISLLKSL